jgi:diguanylate cyclase (GGDEF)-like protein/PAS domain S-box-containing protein
MRRALQGVKGVGVTYDYRGAVVLAAYEPIPDLNWGLVAKIDLSEIRAPYIEAAQYALGLTILLAFGSSVIFWYFLHPLVQNIEDSRRFNRILIESSSTALALCTYEGDIIDANTSFLEIIGLDEINNFNYFDLIADELRDQENKYFNTLKKIGTLNPYETIFINKNKERIDVKVAGKLISIQGSTFIWLSVDNISIQKAYEHQLILDSHHDSLTGLPNRLFFNQIFRQTLARAERSHKNFALFFIDLNLFKEVNDTYGHECGDILLKVIAERLQTNIRSDDFVARLGGDEFTIIFESIKNEKEALTIAKNLIEKTKQPFLIEECEITPSISIGIAFYPEHARDTETLLKCADKAMYHAKHQTKQHYFIYNS